MSFTHKLLKIICFDLQQWKKRLTNSSWIKVLLPDQYFTPCGCMFMLQLPFTTQSTQADNSAYLPTLLQHYIRSFVLLVTMATLKACGIQCATFDAAGWKIIRRKCCTKLFDNCCHTWMHSSDWLKKLWATV